MSITSLDIEFSSDIPLEGDIVEITATISNLGNHDAEDVFIEFWNGEPSDPNSVEIGYGATIDISSSSGLNKVEVSKDWVIWGFGEFYDIYIYVDPSNTISESCEDNNVAFRTIASQGLIITKNNFFG